MIITISGSPGSGKSTVAKLVAKKLGLKHYSTGDFMREMADERGANIIEFSKMAENDESIDKALDERQEKLGREEDDFIIDARLAYHFIPDSIKIFLDVDPKVGAERVFRQHRKDEKAAAAAELQKEIKRRQDFEIKRYKKYYGIDHLDKKNYDLWIDTSRMTPERIVGEIIKFARKHQKL